MGIRCVLEFREFVNNFGLPEEGVAHGFDGSVDGGAIRATQCQLNASECKFHCSIVADPTSPPVPPPVFGLFMRLKRASIFVSVVCPARIPPESQLRLSSTRS